MGPFRQEAQVMNMKLTSVVLLAFLLSAPSAFAQEPLPDLKSALAPLGRMVGNWEKRVTVYKSEWAPEEQTKTGAHTSQWILNDSHLQEAGRDSDGSAYLGVYSYDAAAKGYRASVFRSNGSTWQMTGKWDAKSDTFIFAQDLADGVRLTVTYRFVSPNEFKFSYIAKKGDDKVVYRAEGTAKRVAAGKE
jgi:hypothetical protein